MLAAYREVCTRWPLIKLIVQGQLKASVHRTNLGVFWYALVPLLQIGVYYFLIVLIFARGDQFAVNPFIAITMGVMHFMILNRCISYGTPSIYSNSSLQLQVRIEPLVLVAAAYYKSLRTGLIGVGLFLAIYVAYGFLFSWNLLFYPVILAMWLIFCWIMVLVFACASVYTRDLERISAFVIQVLMYSSPVIYTVNFYPEWLRDQMLYSPPAIIFSMLQWSLFGGPPPSARHVAVLVLVLVVGLFGASAFYLWCRRGFTKAF